MTNNSDDVAKANTNEMAFEEWFNDESLYGYPKSILNECWQAAIAHERKRSEKIVKCLEEIASDVGNIKLAIYANQALKDYRENL